ncbi:endonuclease/exonuclease/phosphatase family protein [Marinisporobacter balticus]|uniref:Endonuclease/exonuclease/phosphatase family metal-dependent hydrolase n=1 Tax=Marinisporobacter balticus TaxID=2018667 RepID=A0A4R2KZG8_9FIRM|nr:endonuclease/exonuclease/phosphatase family protein [Marinisporobacter balticus]TCO80091.1 endonuclease/exonuclease/phosphatase family metal-dependent hydrolase [Marinisporobacter balticus]
MKRDPYFLKVITYNIHSGKNLFMIPQLNKIITFLKNEEAQVIGIQELNENDKRGYQVHKLKNGLHMNDAFAPNVKIGNGYYGVGTFTSFEIMKVNFIPLPSAKEQRGLLHTVLKVGTKELNVLNTHLGLNENKRKSQFKAIEKYIQSIHSPFILMGDFNTTIPKFNTPSMIDTAVNMKKINLPTFRVSQKRIDYVFTSKSIQVHNYQVIPVTMSDHYPVIVEMLI